MKFFITNSFFSKQNIRQKSILMFVLIPLCILASCSSAKPESSENKIQLPPPHINCPEKGDCTFEVLKNSNLSLKFNDQGQLYPEVTAGDQIVIKYHYKKDEREDVMDDSYSEFVYLEIDPNAQQIVLRDKELQKVKMIFGRICFCKGSNGYFRVTSGNLFLFNKNNNLQLRTNFKVNKIPQLVESIDENINY